MWEEIADGGVVDLYSGMQYYEQFIPEGSKVRVRFNLRQSLSPSMVDNLQQRLEDAGVKDVQVTTGSPILDVSFTKGFPWLTIVIAIVLIIAVLIISWRLLIWLEETVPGATRLVLWAGVGLVGVLVLREVVKTKKEFLPRKT